MMPEAPQHVQVHFVYVHHYGLEIILNFLSDEYVYNMGMMFF